MKLPSRPGVSALLIANVALAGSLAWELASSPGQVTISAREQKPLPNSGAAPTLATYAPPASSEFFEISARPAFTAGRRPIAQGVAAPAPSQVAVVQAPPPVAPPPNVALMGIIWGPVEKLALIRMPSSATAQTVSEGETVGEWRVARILPDRIVIRANAGEIEVAFPAPNMGAPTSPAGSSTGIVVVPRPSNGDNFKRP
jgi:hypothetical protein